MNLETAARNRHTVRKYLSKALPETVIKKLRAKCARLNAAHDLNIQLVVNKNDAFKGLGRLFGSHNVRNYFVMAAPVTHKENLGKAAAELMLYCQTLGLNTWYAAGTYSARGARNSALLSKEEYLGGVIAVGYGAVQGKPHKSRTYKQVASYEEPAPDWFLKGVEMALLAPTAMNRQGFRITGKEDRVHIDYDKGPLSEIDLGIVKYFFGLGAGLNHFNWA